MSESRSLGLVLLAFGAILLVIVAGAVAFILKKDNDANDVPDILQGGDDDGTVVITYPPGGDDYGGGIGDGDDAGGGTGGGTDDSGRKVYRVSFAVDANDDGDFDDPGDRVYGAKDADGFIVLTSFTTDNIYSEDHPLYRKLVLLAPESNFKTYMTFKYVGKGTKAVDFNVKLILARGTLPKGYLMHKVGDVKVTVDSVPVSLKPGETKTLTIEGMTPEFVPGKSWWLPVAVVDVDGKEVMRESMWRLDNRLRYRWITLKHEDKVCPDVKILDSCLRVVNKQDRIEIPFSLSEVFMSPGAATDIKRVVIYQITYPGKYVLVYDGKPALDVEPFNPVAFIPRDRVIVIQKSSMATMWPNEGYLKLTVWDNKGNVIDLNPAPNDKSARINIPFKIVGAKAWTSDREYFSSVGPLFMFSTVGGSGHPESEWFE